MKWWIALAFVFAGRVAVCQPMEALGETPKTDGKGKWLAMTAVSKMDDSQSTRLILRADDTVSGWPAFHVEHHPSLVVVCDKKDLSAFIDLGLVPALNVERVPTVRRIVLRFDEEKPREVLVDVGRSPEVVFMRSEKDFARRVRGATRLRVAFDPVNSPGQVATFDVRGFAASWGALDRCKLD
jgi:hypothetical protein